jgi:hypothetical protein
MIVGRSPHYAVEALHTTRRNISTLRDGTSPHYAMAGVSLIHGRYSRRSDLLAKFRVVFYNLKALFAGRKS